MANQRLNVFSPLGLNQPLVIYMSDKSIFSFPHYDICYIFSLFAGKIYRYFLEPENLQV
jgi:hypothetical protein